MVHRRQIPFIKQGARVLFDLFALDRWMQEGLCHPRDATISSSGTGSTSTAPESTGSSIGSPPGSTISSGPGAPRASIDNRIREGDLGWDTVCPTVAEWWESYRTAYSPKKRAPHRDPQLIAPFLARFGTARLDTFKKSDCERWVGERSKHVSARTRRVLAGDTVRREHGFLKGFFQKAVEDGLLKSNPWKGVRAPGHVPRTRVLSYEEEAKLRAALRPDYLRLLTVILGTGMREGELRPEDVTATHVWVTGKFRTTRNIRLRSDVRRSRAGGRGGVVSGRAGRLRGRRETSEV